MAILGYALEYEFMTPRGAYPRVQLKKRFVWLETTKWTQICARYFLREDYGSYNVLIFRLLRYL